MTAGDRHGGERAGRHGDAEHGLPAREPRGNWRSEENKGGRCPCCGALRAEGADDDKELFLHWFAGIHNSRDRLGAVAPPATLAELTGAPRGDEGVVGGTPPGTVDVTAAARGASVAAWWMPSLAYLAYHEADEDARAVLDEFAAHREKLSYAVVEEQTDDIVGLSVQPWPLLDERGRLRFPIDTDPLQVVAPLDDLTRFIIAHRRAWHALGLLDPELVDRDVQIGDAYGAVIAVEPDGPALAVRTDDEGDAVRYLAGLSGADRAVPVPVIDVTWDAREAGKLAHYAAAAGVIDPREPDPAMAEVVNDLDRRYLIALDQGVDARDVGLETIDGRGEDGPR